MTSKEPDRFPFPWTKDHIENLVNNCILPDFWENHMPVSYGLLQLIVDGCRETSKTLTVTLPTILTALKPNVDETCLPSISNISSQLRRKKNLVNPGSIVPWLEDSDKSNLGVHCADHGISVDRLWEPQTADNRVISHGVILELRRYMMGSNFTWTQFSEWLVNLNVTVDSLGPGHTRHIVAKIFNDKSRISKHGTSQQLAAFMKQPFTPPMKNPTVHVHPPETQSHNTGQVAHKTGNYQIQLKHTPDDLRKLKIEVDELLLQLSSQRLLQHKTERNSNVLSHRLEHTTEKLEQLQKEKVHWDKRNVTRRERRKDAKIRQLKKSNSDLRQLNTDLEERLRCASSASMEFSYDVEKMQRSLKYFRQKAHNMGLKMESMELDVAAAHTHRQQAEREASNIQLEMEALLQDRLLIPVQQNGKYTDEFRSTCMELHSLGLSTRNVTRCIKVVAERLFNVNFPSLPSEATIRQFLVEANILGKLQVGAALLSNTKNTLHFDGTTDHQKHFIGYQVSLPSQSSQPSHTLTLGMVETLTGDTETHLLQFKGLIKECSTILATPDQQEEIEAQMILSIKNIMTDQHIVNKKFAEELEKLRLDFIEKVEPTWLTLSKEERSKIIHINQWFCLLHLLLGIAEGIETGLKEYERILSSGGAIPLGRLALPGMKCELSSCSEAIKGCAVLTTSRGHPAAGLPEDFSTFLDSKQKRNFFKNYKHNRFNIMCHNAVAVIHHKSDLLEFLNICTHDNQLISAVKADLRDPNLTSVVRAVALFHTNITAPLHSIILKRDSAPNIMDMNPILQSIQMSLEELSRNPELITAGRSSLSGKISPCQGGMFQIPPEDDSNLMEVCLEAFGLICTAVLVTFSRQVKHHLSVVDNVELRAEAESVPKSNSISESQFALLKHLKNFKPNASINHLETTILWCYNKPGDWLQGLSEEERQRLFAAARSNAPDFQKKWQDRKLALKKARFQLLTDKASQREEKLKKAAATKQVTLDSVLQAGGQFKSSKEVADLLVSGKPEKEIKAVLKTQLSFYKAIIQPSSVDRSKFFVTSKGKQLPNRQLGENLSFIINQHMSSLAGHSSEPQIPGPLQRQQQIVESKKAILSNYNPTGVASSTTRGMKRKQPMPDVCGKHIRYRWKLTKKHKWFSGKVLQMSNSSSQPSFPEDEESSHLASYSLYDVKYDGDDTVYKICLEKDWYRGDIEVESSD